MIKKIYKYVAKPLDWDAEEEETEELFFTTEEKLFEHAKEEFLEGRDDDEELAEIMKEFKKDGYYNDNGEHYYSWEECKLKS